MAQVVPIAAGDTNQLISTSIDGESYVLRVRWNTRDTAWYLDAWERDGTTAIAFGVKIVVGVLLGQSIQHPLFMTGIFAWSTTGSDVDPGISDLGGNVLLITLTAGDRVLLAQPVVS